MPGPLGVFCRAGWFRPGAGHRSSVQAGWVGALLALEPGRAGRRVAPVIETQSSPAEHTQVPGPLALEPGRVVLA
ncbi:hypothetical protein [Ottowia sp.]|uniref:hypothetical protein n=1 Tax=Ottowia sp. TaxID=1898956 RepID=UPI0025EAC1AA|nr:hypothetical protein [Ottowia sp.]MBK6616216.1 hypothetical protein [Ottowia sp.]